MFLYYPQTSISSLISGSPVWMSNLSCCNFALYQLKLKLYFPECPTWYGSLLAMIAQVILLKVWKMEGKQETYFLHLEGWYKTLVMLSRRRNLIIELSLKFWLFPLHLFLAPSLTYIFSATGSLYALKFVFSFSMVLQYKSTFFPQ